MATLRRVMRALSWTPLRLREIAALALGDADAGLALKDEQVEGRRLAGQFGEQAMRLAAMMRLMIEEMEQQRREILLDLDRAARRPVAQGSGEIGLAEAADIGADARILDASCGAQLGEIVVEDRIERRRLAALAGEAMHPDTVAKQEMIQRSVQRSEKGAAIGAIVGIGDARRRLVEAVIDPLVIGRQHFELGFHRSTPTALVLWLGY